MKKLYIELRRREVFRTAGLYVGIAWIVIEVASVLLPVFGAPEEALRWLVIVAMVGFPIALVLSWIFDITEKGLVVQPDATGTVVLPVGGRKMDFVVIGVLSVALIVSLYLNIARSPGESAPLEPLSLLIADFDNQTGDPLFDGSLEQALQIGMEGAAFVTNYSRAEAEAIARQTQEVEELDAAAARLVAVREGIGLVLSGSIVASGESYDLEVTAIEPRDGEVVAEASERADGKPRVLTAMEQIANDLRRQLGDETIGRGEEDAETYTVRSLEAAREYDIAQSLQRQGELEAAITHYRAATEHDPAFGRAWSGWAIAAHGLGRTEESKQAWQKALEFLGSMTERERLRTMGIYYYGVTRNYQKAIETYETLVEKYPADSVGHNNLAISYFSALDFDDALREGRIALDIYPNDTLTRSNYALYAMYASDFETAAAQARSLLETDEPYFKAWLPIAVQALDADDPEAAREAYRAMAATGGRGAATASLGLADVELFTGDAAAARDVLVADLEQAGAASPGYLLATRYIALAEAHLGSGDRDAALQAVDEGLALTDADAIAVPAALLRIAAGVGELAEPLADSLAARLQPQSRAYAELVLALGQLEQGRHIEAIDRLSSAIALADLWLLRYYLGRAYFAGGFHAEALDEFMMADQRRGEATAVFLDDLPSYRYASTLPYWLARAQDELGMAGEAAGNYQRYIARRRGDDPLAVDARERIE